MDPLSMGIGAAGSLLGGIFSSSAQSRNINRQIQFQREENALSRQFNSDEAQKSRDFTALMNEKQNQYNSASAQVDRLVAAGLNPALMYGSSPNNTSDFMNSSAQASSSGSISPMGFDTSGITAAAQGVANIGLVNAQTELAKANAAKIREETEWVSRLGTVQEALGQKQFDEIVEKIQNLKTDRKEAEKRMEVMDENITNLKQNYVVLMQQGQNLAKEGQLLDKQIEYADEKILSDIAQANGMANLSNKQSYILGLSEAAVIADSQMKEGQSFLFGLSVNSIKSKIKELGLSKYLDDFEWRKVELSLQKFERDATGNALDWVNAFGGLLGNVSSLIRK